VRFHPRYDLSGRRGQHRRDCVDVGNVGADGDVVTSVLRDVVDHVAAGCVFGSRSAASPYDQEMDAVAKSPVPDVLAPGLQVVFCGINPGRWSDAAGAHFANPRNDFWRLLHDVGFTPRLYAPEEQHELPAIGLGLTNAAYRTTPGSGDLRRADFEGSAVRLEALARRLHPAWIAFVGKEGYRGAFNERPELGLQERQLGDTQLFVLPSTSPANAAVPYAERLRWFRELRELAR
jgi:double-stranded uracil-DNA glycosylase